MEMLSLMIIIIVATQTIQLKDLLGNSKLYVDVIKLDTQKQQFKNSS